MGLFGDAGEVYEIYATLFDLLGRDPRIGFILANAGLIVQFRLSDPDGTVTLTMRDKPIRSGMYMDSIVGECTIESDIVLVTSSDLSNRFLQGKINIVRALMTGQIKTKGRTGKALKPVSSIEPVFQIYPRLLREKGWNHLLV
jgi:hypothetical protein